MDAELYELSGRLGDALREAKLVAATAESCTGGWIAQTITMVPGSSGWFDCGFVTYTNDAKRDMLGVKAETLQKFGAVSEQTVKEMAAGALARSTAQVAVAVSGIAGPGGGSAKKPVGTVMLAWASRDGECLAEQRRFGGDRDSVRRQSVVVALEGLLALIERRVK
ncbi:MAG: nicotinamide-nucleotide amidase [Burkholderiales bacterium]